MINKEFIVSSDGSIYKDFIDRNIPQNSNNQVSVNVLIPASCFTGLQNYAVLLTVSRIISGVETTLNTLVMSASKSITIDGVLYVKYSAYLTIGYTNKLGTLKVSPYIQTTTTTTINNVETEVVSIQQAFTNTNLNVIKSVAGQFDASLEDAEVVEIIEAQINAKKIYTFIDNESASVGEHYYNLATSYNPNASQFSGCIVISIYDGETRQYIPYINNDEVELLEITKDGVFYKISDVSYDSGTSTYTYTRQQISYTKAEVDSQVSDLQTQINGKVDKTQKVNGHALSGDITLTKGDVGLGNVANYGVESTPTSSGSDLYITSKGVYDALQLIYSTLSGYATQQDISNLDSRLDSVEAIIGSDDGDADSVINTLKEVIVVLNGLGEGANLLDLINAKANQSDLTALNNQINGEDGIKDKVDLLSERTNAYMEIKNSLGTTIDIAVEDWEANISDENYPYKWTLTNGYLEGAVNCIVVYSKDSDTSMLSATTGIDEENGKLIIYASELPTETISIEKIAVFNDLNAYINYSNEIVQQVMQNTSAISDINNTKLPLYELKQESLGSGNGTKTFAIVNGAYIQQAKYGSGASLKQARLILKKDYAQMTYQSGELAAYNAYIKLLKEANSDKAYIEMETKDHTLKLDSNGLTLDGNAVGGGGKQLYQHILKISITGVADQYVSIINDSNDAFDFTALKNYLNTNNFSSGLYLPIVSSGDGTGVGLYYDGGSSIYLKTTNGQSAFGNASIKDRRVAL